MDLQTQLNILDTHVWLWLMEGDPRIGPSIRAELERAATVGSLCVTSLSLWEMAMLESVGRVRFVVPVSTWLEEALQTPGLTLLDIDAETAAESTRLPGRFSGDPVDRLLVAAARTRGGRLFTADPVIAAYGEAGHVDVGVVGSTAP